MVHRFSHSVRFSGLGLSFHLSSSHSQPWAGERDVEERVSGAAQTLRGLHGYFCGVRPGFFGRLNSV